MSQPTFDDLRRLADWRPALGVISVYLPLDPADRARAWHTQLRNGMAAVLGDEESLDHETRTALRATVKRIEARFDNHERTLPRGEVGFVEVAAEAGEERWWATHITPESTATARFSDRPVVAPLLCLVEHGAPRGVALVSSERVRLLEWSPGHVDDLHNWELSVFSRDWREQKAPRVQDPARAQAVSASGKEQYEDRLADSRNRFLGECRRLALGIGRERGWPELFAFGTAQQADRFRDGAETSPPIEPGAELDLISKPDAELLGRIEEAVKGHRARRERETVERVLAEAQGGRRGTAGPQETQVALDESRVELLVLSTDHAARAAEADGDGREVAGEILVRSALAGGAQVCTVSEEADELLSDVDGVAALLRY
jgi:hypothetical protein